LFCAPAATVEFPYWPEESIVPFPARVKSRSMAIEGVWVV